MQFNAGQREIILKVVYYGPPLSGKTTNLQALHRLLNPDHCGRLVTLDTADDRTLFFDLLPLSYSGASNYQVKIKLFTVPGQVVHAATRRVVLAGADGVVFVADAQLEQAKNNTEYWHGMRGYVEESGLDLATVPTVIQFNKMDLPNARSHEELAELQNSSAEPLFDAVAIRGEGVLETLEGLLRAVFRQLNERYDFQNKFGLTADEFINGLFAQANRDALKGPGKQL